MNCSSSSSISAAEASAFFTSIGMASSSSASVKEEPILPSFSTRSESPPAVFTA